MEHGKISDTLTQEASSVNSTQKQLGQRQFRVETRNRSNDLRRQAANKQERVRKWEKRLVEIDSTSLKVYKWVPVTNN